LFDAWNNSIMNVTRSSPGTSNIGKDITPCQKTCVYRLELDNESPFTLNSTTIKYVSTNEKYLINPLEPEIVLVNVNDREKGYARIYYNNESPANISPINGHYNSDLNYSEIDNSVNNSPISFDFDGMNFFYKGVDWIDTRGWTTCTDTCTNSFSEIKFIEKGSERVVVWTNTSVGVDYYFHFYPNTTYFKVITNSDTNHSFGPDWAVNNTNDTHYSFKDSRIMGLGDDDNYVDKYNLTGPETYIMKNDDNSRAAVIFNTNLLQANNSIKINDTSIIIRAYIPGTYGFVINEEPSKYLTPTITNQYGTEINYSYNTGSLSMSGRLLN